MIERPSMEYLNNLKEYPFGDDILEEGEFFDETKNEDVEEKGIKIKIDWQKVKDGLSRTGEIGKNLILYQDEISPGLDLKIVKNEALGGLSFKILSQGNEERGEELAELIFCFSPHNRGLEIKHRLVTDFAKRLGVNGSNFLFEAEKYMRFFLEKKSAIDQFDNFFMFTSQVSVIKWALKNGFGFQSKRQAEYYESIMSGKEQDVVITDDFSKPDGSYGNYIVEKYKIERLKKIHKEKIPFFIYEHSIRFKLIKSIWPEEETQNN